MTYICIYICSCIVICSSCVVNSGTVLRFVYDHGVIIAFQSSNSDTLSSLFHYLLPDPGVVGVLIQHTVAHIHCLHVLVGLEVVERKPVPCKGGGLV